MSENDAPQPQVHPTASAIGRLVSTMSLKDQQWAYNLMRNSINLTGLVLFPIAYWYQTFSLFAYGVILVSVLVSIVTVPNWRQREDVESFVSTDITERFYDRLIKAWSEGGATDSDKKRN